MITTRSANYDTSYLEPKQRQHPKICLRKGVWSWDVVFAFSLFELCLLFRLKTWGEIGFANENYFLQKQMNCKCHTCFYFFFLLGAWVWWELLSMNHFSQCFALFCPLPRVWAAVSLHERNNLKWRNTSMSPFPPPPPRVIIQLIFFPPLVPAIGAVITIYLGSLFHYSRAAAKPEEKCCVLWFMEAIWPVLIRRIYRMWCRLWK